MGERVDLVTAQGSKHIHGLPIEDAGSYSGYYIPVAVVGMFDDFDRVLVQQRSNTSTRRIDRLKLELCTGVISSGEQPIETARREAFKEVGINPQALTKLAEGPCGLRSYAYLFAGRASHPPENINKEEISWAELMTEDEVRRLAKLKGYEFVVGFFEHMKIIRVYQQLLKNYKLGHLALNGHAPISSNGHDQLSSLELAANIAQPL